MFVRQLIKLRHAGLLWQFSKAPPTKVRFSVRMVHLGMSCGVRATLSAALQQEIPECTAH